MPEWFLPGGVNDGGVAFQVCAWIGKSDTGAYAIQSAFRAIVVRERRL